MINVTSNSLAKYIAKRRWIRRLEVFSIPKKGWIEYEGKRLSVDLSDWRGPSYHVLSWGLESYEDTNVGLLMEYFRARPDGVFFDVGANIGIYSFRLGLQYPNLTVRAFEPEPISHSCVQETLAQFPAAKTYQLALSDKEGASVLFSDASNNGGHSLSRSAIIEDGSAVGTQLSIQTRTLDSFVAENKVNAIDAIKLDVQRHEGAVLAGAVDSIRRFRPLVMMECYYEDLKEGSPLLAPFLGQEYAAVDPRDRSVHAVDAGALQARRTSGESYGDFAFIPREKLSQLSL